MVLLCRYSDLEFLRHRSGTDSCFRYYVYIFCQLQPYACEWILFHVLVSLLGQHLTPCLVAQSLELSAENFQQVGFIVLLWECGSCSYNKHRFDSPSEEGKRLSLLLLDSQIILSVFVAIIPSYK